MGDALANMEVEQHNLGQRVRELRKAQSLTLEQLSSRSGIAPSTISKVENNLMSPTYDVLRKLSAGLDMQLVELLAEQKAPSTADPRYTITRAGEGQRRDVDLLNHEMLCSEVTDKPFLPFVTRISTSSLEEHGPLHTHGGVDFFYVLSGSCTVLTEQHPPAHLEVGDSIFFDASMGHALLKRGEEDAVVLWVANAPE
ncbi:helix-turn-helix domain-containing protein [Rhodovibrionaceae bacterium A322]